MKTKLSTLSPRTLTALAVAGVVLWGGFVWLLYVAPKRSEASRLGEEVAAAEVRLLEAQAAAHRPAGSAAPVSDVFRLAKAMPATSDQAGLVLELTRLATRTGLRLRSITPQPPAEGAGGATMIPVALSVGGSYREITRFLMRTGLLVSVRGGRLHAKGRMFTVESVELAESTTSGFPELDGAITLNAYVYDGPIVPAEGSKGGAGSSGSELSPNSRSAAGSTS